MNYWGGWIWHAARLSKIANVSLETTRVHAPYQSKKPAGSMHNCGRPQTRDS